LKKDVMKSGEGKKKAKISLARLFESTEKKFSSSLLFLSHRFLPLPLSTPPFTLAVDAQPFPSLKRNAALDALAVVLAERHQRARESEFFVVGVVGAAAAGASSFSIVRHHHCRARRGQLWLRWRRREADHSWPAGWRERRRRPERREAHHSRCVFLVFFLDFNFDFDFST